MAVEFAWVADLAEGLELLVVEPQMHQVHHVVDYPSVLDLEVRRVVDLEEEDLLVRHLVLLWGGRLHQQVEVHLLGAFLVQILEVHLVVVLLLVDL